MNFSIIFMLTILSVVYANIEFDPLSDEFISYINSKQTTWRAGRNFDDKTTIEDIKKLINTKTKPRARNHKQTENYHSKDIVIPETFDARDNWPHCRNLISMIPDQSACTSGWAVSATASMTDRRCIASNGELQVPVSAEDLMSCCVTCGYGCGGGDIHSAWVYWSTNGIATGGPYNSSKGCKPYSLEPCEHYVKGDRKQCTDLKYDTPTCKAECSSDLDYKKELTFAASQPIWVWQAEDIQREILQNGPVQAGFVIYPDFLNYKSGVYQYTSGDDIGGQGAKIIGWGTENGVPYWLCINSWNEDWGAHGLFKIIRGINSCGIEGEILVSLPKL